MTPTPAVSSDTARLAEMLGRLSADMGRDAEGRATGARLTLKLKPNKTNQAGETTQVKTFIVDTDSDALSAGKAIRQMLNGDAANERDDKVPLFRNPATGKLVTYN